MTTNPAKANAEGDVNGLKDPASAENRNFPVHRWVPWIAGFSARFVDDVLSRFLPRANDHSPLVLDPFCGVGTTLLACLQRRIDSVGFEINPYAVLASRAKTNIRGVHLGRLNAAIEAYRRRMLEFDGESSRHGGAMDLLPRSQPPEGFKTRIPFYSRPVLLRTLATMDFISELDDQAIRELFLVAFGSVMVKFSNYSYEPSLASRPGSGKPLIEDAPVAQILVLKLQEMLEDLAEVRGQLAPLEALPVPRVFDDTFFNARRYLGDNAVDLAVTSPPYLNNYHYVRNTRPQLWWLGLVDGRARLRTLEDQSMGKFWQTVRDSEPVALRVPLPQAEAIVSAIRERNPEEGPYGGPGWSNYVASYFNDLSTFTQVLAQVLRPGAHGVVVVGNSIIQGFEIKVDQVLSSIAALNNLATEGTEIIRAKRVGSSIVDSNVRSQGDARKVALYDAAVILRK